MTIAVLVGNPRRSSRTMRVAVAAGTLIREHLDLDQSLQLVDLAELGESILDPASEPTIQAAGIVTQSRVCVVASPTYKASYTGLLKLFLDGLPTHALDDVVAIPLMVGAGPAHALAADVFLRPVLLELGATCPTPSLFVPESELDDLSPRLDSWYRQAKRAWPVLAHA